MYKVGDKVTIKPSLDPGCSADDYPFGFISWMVNRWGGKELTIEGVFPIPEKLCTRQYKIPVDGYAYYMKESGYTWVSSMFCSLPNSPTIF